MISEHLDENLIPEELEKKYETAPGYSEGSTNHISRICLTIEMFERTAKSTTANLEAVEPTGQQAFAVALRPNF